MFTYVGNNPINRIDPMGLEKVLCKVINLFNNYGNKFSNVGGSNLTLPNILGYSNDYDPSFNVLFASVTLFGEANIKVNQNIRDGAVWINESDCKDSIRCGKKIVLGDKEVWLSDLGNLLYGYNGAKIGFSYKHIENYASKVTDYSIEDGAAKDKDNEKNDRPFYKAGYLLGLQNEGNITKDDLINMLSLVYNSDEIFKQSRKGW